LNYCLFSLRALVLVLFRPNPVSLDTFNFDAAESPSTPSPLLSLRRHTSRFHHLSSPQSLPSFQTVNSDDLRDASSLQLLTNMRFAFQRAEQALYSQLRDTPNSALNNVPREFHFAARGASKRLAAWEAKHVSKDARPRLAADRKAIQEPHW
jgi:1-phosphatidylinositol-3-phosphate 5-kinase